jgi:hypothetical protein
VVKATTFRHFALLAVVNSLFRLATRLQCYLAGSVLFKGEVNLFYVLDRLASTGLAI